MGTDLYHRADRLVGGIDAWVGRRRAAGESWVVVARELYLTTGGEIDVTHETLRRWCGNDRAA